jgi:hypothetical protein
MLEESRLKPKKAKRILPNVNCPNPLFLWGLPGHEVKAELLPDCAGQEASQHCHPVAFMIAASVAPVRIRSKPRTRSCLVLSFGAPGRCCALRLVLELPALAGLMREGNLVFDTALLLSRGAR